MVYSGLHHPRKSTHSSTKNIANDATAAIVSNQSSVLQSFLAGSISGAISCVLFQPLDLVKTRLQASVTTGGQGKAKLRHQSNSLRSNTIVTMLHNVIQRDNVFALWKGLTPSLYRTVPGVGMYFCVLQWMKSFYNTDTTFYQNLFLGFTARSSVGIVMLPITVIKARFESGKFHYKTVSQALHMIWKVEGFGGLFSGCTATIARDAPFSGLYLMFYSQEKIMMASLMDRDLGPSAHFACGLMAGLLASVATHPADVTKTQLQLYPSRYQSTKHCLTTIFQEYGISGFYRGIIPRCLRRTLVSALSWTVFEKIMKKLNLKV